MGNVEEKKVGVAVLYSTRYGNPKGTRIGPPLFIHQNYKANIINLLQYQFLINHSIIRFNF